jgi:hypothetical protein
LFHRIADGEAGTSRVDTALALRRGRVRLRWRRFGLAAAPVAAAAAAVIVALAVAAGPVRPGAGPPAAGPAAPRQFNPLVPYLSFGWLPAGSSLVAGGVRPEMAYLTAGPTADSPRTWNLAVYAAGQCHLTGSDAGLKCSTEALAGSTVRITGRAPAVRGHRAFWAGPALVWQYARGGWAELSLPYPYYIPKLSTPAGLAKARRQAVKIADNVRYGAPTPPLKFSVQLTHLPATWRVSSVYYLPDAGVLRVSRFALGTGTPNLGADGGLEYQTNLPYFSTLDPTTFHKFSCYVARRSSDERSAVKTINGYRVVLTHQAIREVLGTSHRQDLCSARANGLSLYISEFGAHPPLGLARLFRDHVRLLGANPASWTTKPIG